MMSQLLGWVGAALVIWALYLNARNPHVASTAWYWLINILGASGVGASAAATRNWPIVVLEVVWAAVSLFGLIHRNRDQPRAE